MSSSAAASSSFSSGSSSTTTSPTSLATNKRKRTSTRSRSPSLSSPKTTLPTTPSRSVRAQEIKLQIPITPPTSSHTQTPIKSALTSKEVEGEAEEMRHATTMNGVQYVVPEEDTGSPRTKVAYHFQGLQLEDGGDVSKLSLDMQRSNVPVVKGIAKGGREEEEGVRKRLRVLEREIPETPGAMKLEKEGRRGGEEFGISFGPERIVDPVIEERARKVVLRNEIDPAVMFDGGGRSPEMKGPNGLARAYPSINRLSESKSRGKLQRKETYPLFGAADASVELAREVKEDKSMDESRAKMTWRENEITGHNPSDPEDDGEGINGIGFRPTAAEAYQRGQRRKQQMAEYKSREAKEARARRHEKRRETDARSVEEKEVARRVRFMEAEKEAVVIDI